MINEKHGQGTHSTKMGADKLAQNTPNASEGLWLRWSGPLSAQIVCPSPKIWDIDEKRLYLASVVRA